MGGIVRIGTSGWSYPHWRRGVFYPEGLPQRAEADYARASFPTLELNATFYRLPTPTTVARWRDRAPQGFVYAVKGSRFITHLKRLTNLDDAVDNYVARIAPLAPVMAVVLWQLPPDLERDVPRLTTFLDHVAERFADVPARHAVEFRHPSWLHDTAYAALSAHGVANTWLSSPLLPFLPVPTTDVVYVRFHGLTGYAHDYTDREMAAIAAAVSDRASGGADVYVYFNNDGAGRAPRNARRFAELLDPALVHPPVGVRSRGSGRTSR
jgi:uncharacterized protein YecE (DUF72 family)